MKTIKTDAGLVSGTTIGEPGHAIEIYRGIPYAAPPVGALRWRPPQPAKPWSGTRVCTSFSPWPPQGYLIPPDRKQQEVQARAPRTMPFQSEDCLYLNVLAPARDPGVKLPVMVWLHGGGFAMGSGNEPLANFHRLPQHGVVLVTVNGRLGPLGLLAHPDLTAESPDHSSGNYLFLDLIAALQWVQRNIAAFGGDPDNVTIFGESGGGAKVISLMCSPLAKGLFHKAIAESGSPDGQPLADLEAMGERFFSRLGVTDSPGPLKAARSLPWERILETDRQLVEELQKVGRGGLWDVAIDGWFLPDVPLNTFRRGRQYPVPLLLLANRGELTTTAGSYLVPHYLEELRGLEKAGTPGRAIVFDKVPSTWLKEGCFSHHALELGYVFGDWENATGFWDSIFMIAGSAGARSRDPGLDETDRRVSELMMSLWTRFARTGDPSGATDDPWPVWETATDRYLYVNESSEVKTGFSKLAGSR